MRALSWFSQVPLTVRVPAVVIPNGAIGARFSPDGGTLYLTDATGLGDGSWTPVPSLEFASPANPSGSATALDGNAPGNRLSLSASLPLSIPAGGRLWIRFRGDDLAGNENAMAVDDFSITAIGPDADGDTVADPADNCPSLSNSDQANSDGAAVRSLRNVAR